MKSRVARNVMMMHSLLAAKGEVPTGPAGWERMSSKGACISVPHLAAELVTTTELASALSCLLPCTGLPAVFPAGSWAPSVFH